MKPYIFVLNCAEKVEGPARFKEGHSVLVLQVDIQRYLVTIYASHWDETKAPKSLNAILTALRNGD